MHSWMSRTWNIDQGQAVCPWVKLLSFLGKIRNTGYVDAYIGPIKDWIPRTCMSSPAGSSHRTHNFWVVNTRVPLYLLSKMMIASPYDVHRDSKVKLLKWSIGRPSAVYANLSCNWLIHSSFCNSRRPRVICGSSLLLTGYLPFTQELRPHSILLWASCITHLSKLRNSWQGSAPISCTLPHSKALAHWRQVQRNYLFQKKSQCMTILGNKTTISTTESNKLLGIIENFTYFFHCYVAIFPQ